MSCPQSAIVTPFAKYYGKKRYRPVTLLLKTWVWTQNRMQLDHRDSSGTRQRRAIQAGKSRPLSMPSCCQLVLTRAESGNAVSLAPAHISPSAARPAQLDSERTGQVDLYSDWNLD
jgi:hypothetical protein